jgi:3-deoxy-7-phosphoheptulonate synthase/chorismate mutase
MTESQLRALRERINTVNMELLELLSERGRLVNRIRQAKEHGGQTLFDPKREQHMLDELVEANPGPFADETVRTVFKKIFHASLDFMASRKVEDMMVSRKRQPEDQIVEVRGWQIGNDPFYIAGPCAVESDEQMERVARRLAALKVPFMRGGAFKPRTSPYSFQGLGVEGLKILRAAAARHGLRTVTEVTDTRTVGLVAEFADVLQIGARNMFNYELLKEVGRAQKPVLLKRGFAATADEFLQAAEYIMLAGCKDVILCERGIRTFSRRTRNTLDISVVPLLRRLSPLPVVVDPSHAAGRKDVLVDLTAAAFAAGAHGVMIEVHPEPSQARSDANQQLNLDEFEELLGQVNAYAACRLPSLDRPRPATQEGVGTSCV